MSSSRRRVAWLSPFAQASDISRFTHCLLPHMRQEMDANWQFTLFVNDNGRRFDSVVPAASIHSASDIAHLLSDFDHAVYNVGNNAENHGRIAATLRQRPGVVVLHDLVFQHLLAWECIEKRASRKLYMRLMGDVYGRDGVEAVLKSGLMATGPRRYSIWDTPLAETFPFVEMLARLASGIVVHSEYSERAARAVFDGPILRLALPWDQKPSLTDDEVDTWAKRTRTGRCCTFAAFGHIGRSKNLDVLIRAFVERPELKSSARLVIAGYPGDRGYIAELEQAVAHYHLTECVTFAFGISDGALRQLKMDADAFINIRMPVTEAASGSLTEQLNAGKPVIVYNKGAYAELPAGAAIKLEPVDGESAVADAMVALARDPEERVRIGAAGRAHVRRIGSAEYVSQLKDFLVAEEPVLARRHRVMAPVPAASSWTAAEIVADDKKWFQQLTAARALWNGMDLDPLCWSPAPYLEWPAEQAIRFGLCAVLGLELSINLERVSSRIFESRGGWEYYRIVQILRRKLWLVRQENLPGKLAAHDRQLIDDVDYWRLVIHLESLTVARLLVVSILGRGWELGEDFKWADILNRESDPRTVLAQFLTAPEIKGMKGAAPGVRRILDWCSDEDSDPVTGREAQAAIFSWPVSTKIEFGRADGAAYDIFQGAWHVPEPSGRWTRGRQGVLRFALDPAADADLTFVLDFRLAGSTVTGPREVTVSSSHGFTQTITVDSDRIRSFSMKLAKSDHPLSPVTLRIEVSRSVSLAELKLSSDTRDLGVLLIAGELRLAEGGKRESAPTAAKPQASVSIAPPPAARSAPMNSPAEGEPRHGPSDSTQGTG